MLFLQFFLYSVFFVRGLLSYKCSHYKEYICIFFLLITDCIGVFVHSHLHGRDVALLLIFVCIFYLKAKGERLIERGDKVGKAIFLLMIWFLLRTIITVLDGTEGLVKAVMVFRFDLFYLCYFVFKRIPYEAILRSIPFFVIATIMGSVLLFYAYFSTGSFLAVSPGAIEICFFVAIFLKGMKHRKIALFFTSFLLILGTSRGLLIAIPVSFLLYLFIEYRHHITFRFKHVVVLGVVAAIASSLIINKLSKDVGKGDGLKEEMTIVADILKYQTYYSYDHSMVNTVGTFAFRIALFAERVDYMINNPKILFFGVGAMHEDTAQNKFSFNLGTHRAEGDKEQGQIDTGDVSFIMEWMRYGIIYLFMFLYLAILVFKRLSQNSIFVLCTVAWVLLIELFIRSLASSPFLGSEFNFYFILLVVASIYRYSSSGLSTNIQTNLK